MTREERYEERRLMRRKISKWFDNALLIIVISNAVIWVIVEWRWLCGI